MPVIVLTMHRDVEHVRAALEAGAAGYLVKSSAPSELFEAISEVLAGREYVTTAVGGKVMGSLLSSGPPPTSSPLTRREDEVASLVAQGMETSEIADHLCIAEVTVRTHIKRIFEKLGLRNRIELARYVLEKRQ